MNKPSRRSAFTLVELLVVVAIIALLIAILLPAMQKAKYQARLTVCGAQVHQIVIASIAYAAEFEGYYPSSTLVKSGTQQKYRARVNEIPTTLEPFCGGSVDPNKNKMWRCPEAYSRSGDLHFKPGSYYALYYNSISSLYHGIDVSQSYDADGGEPTNPTEAMRRMGRPRIFKSWRVSGEAIDGWRSHIIASDLAYRTNGTEAGHMWGGEYHITPYSALKYASNDAVCTANYGFDDGSVRAASFTDDSVRGAAPPNMARAAGGPFDWDNYLQPRDAVTPYP